MIMISLKPWSEANKAAVLFAEKVITSKGEVRWSLPVRKAGRPRRVEACETARKTAAQQKAYREANRLFKQKRIAEGYCHVCCVTVVEEGFKSCAPCRAKRNAYKARIVEARILEDICTRCGTNEALAGRICGECRAVDRVKRQQRRVELKAAGVCRQCEKRPIDGSFTRCAPCRQINDSHRKKLRATRLAQGLCYCCGVNPAPAGQGCITCRQEKVGRKDARTGAARRRLRSKEDIEALHILRLERIAAGYCHNCSLRRPEEGKTNCTPCRQRRAARAAQLTKARRDRNLCVRCGETESPAGKYCASCRKADNIKNQVRRLERIAAGLCYRCGSDGADASLCARCRSKEKQRDRSRGPANRSYQLR
jgi:hypothetical protein